MELGGNAPFIVFDEADLRRRVEGAARLQVTEHRQNLRVREPAADSGQVYDALCRQAHRKGQGRMKVGKRHGARRRAGPLIEPRPRWRK